MMGSIYLFDVDGVLVLPGGYRASVRATVNALAQRMGLGPIAPSDDVIAIFESQGITCEWDMIPILLALGIEAALAQANQTVGVASLQAAIDELPALHLECLQIDFAPVLRTLGAYVKVGQSPAESLLENPPFVLFPRLARQGVLRDLFSHTRSLTRSLTTRYFALYALGSEEYRALTGAEAPYAAPSLLLQEDRPLLNAAMREALLTALSARQVRAAAFTARPSLPLNPAAEGLAVYAPEAEAALKLVGLESLMLVGSGQMTEAALRLGENVDRMVKPAAYHALAAALSAWMEDRCAALAWVEQAFLHFERGAPAPALPFYQPTDAPWKLCVFEDSPSGMHAVKEAARMLQQLGVPVSVELSGITTHPEKQRALQREGAVIYTDINEALCASLSKTS